MTHASVPDMPGYQLSAETRFSAAHTLPGVEKCDQLHGHNWRVRVTVHVQENQLDERGMGIDFRVLETIVKDSVADLDHQHLNALAPFQDHAPTAEYVAKLVAGRSQDQLATLQSPAVVSQVEVWELPEYRVVYRP